MLGTLKAKIIAGAAAAAVAAGGVTAAVVIANSSDDGGYTSRTESTVSSITVNNFSDNEPQNSASGSEQSTSPFWLARQVWTEPPRGEFDGGILGDNRKTLNLYEIDELSAPFYSSILYSDDKKTDKFSDVWYSPKDITDYDYVEVETQCDSHGDYGGQYDGIGMIRIFNFDNIPHSVEDCLENGWWKTAATEESFLYETVTLGLDDSLRDGSETPHEDKLLDAVIAKFGTPHYVRYLGYTEAETEEERRRAIYVEMDKANDPQYDGQYITAAYDLVYELDNDLIMTVAVWEQRSPDGGMVINLDYAEFWSGACWENRSEVSDMDSDWEEIALFEVYQP